MKGAIFMTMDGNQTRTQTELEKFGPHSTRTGIIFMQNPDQFLKTHILPGSDPVSGEPPNLEPESRYYLF